MNDEVNVDDGVVEIVEHQVDKEFEELQGKYDNLKSKVGTLANERAELLKLNNELLQQQHTESDWDIDPAERKAEQALNEVRKLEQEAKKRDLARDFPGFQDEVTSEAFQSWVTESPYRQKRYVAADAMDFDAARELLNEWSEKKGAANEVQQRREADRKNALNNASMEKGSAGGTGKKVWDRDWLVEQQVHNPGWYRANYTEIMAAYREGRVKKRK